MPVGTRCYGHGMRSTGFLRMREERGIHRTTREEREPDMQVRDRGSGIRELGGTEVVRIAKSHHNS